MKLKELKDQLTGKSVEDSLKVLVSLFPEQVIFTTSFGIEDQAITHKIFSNNLNIKVATLDTGRLFPETYVVFSQTILKFGKTIHTYFPDNSSVEKLLTEKGPFSFYDSVENRKECCHIRKVVPLTRALSGMKVWISGVRADQSGNRHQMDWIEYDEDKNLFKFYPVFSWTYQDVKDYVRTNNIPYNTLHDKGFVSIGCEPCTRAIEPGEDFRAGRWWWENDGARECGLHVK